MRCCLPAAISRSSRHRVAARTSSSSPAAISSRAELYRLGMLTTVFCFWWSSWSSAPPGSSGSPGSHNLRARRRPRAPWRCPSNQDAYTWPAATHRRHFWRQVMNTDNATGYATQHGPLEPPPQRLGSPNGKLDRTGRRTVPAREPDPRAQRSRSAPGTLARIDRGSDTDRSLLGLSWPPCLHRAVWIHRARRTGACRHRCSPPATACWPR
jgi:hypothetical protein